MAMIVIPRRVPWRRKPPNNRQIDSRFRRDLSFGFIFTEGAGEPYSLDGVAGQLVSSTWGVGVGGKKIIHDAIGDRTVVSADTSAIPTQVATIFLGYAKRDGTLRNSGAFGVSNAISAERCGTHLPWTDGNVYFDFGGATAGSTRVVASGVSDFQTPAGWAFTTGPRGMEIWKDGRIVGSNSANPTRTASSNDFRLGQHYSSNSDLADFYYFLLFKSQLPQSVIAKATQTIDSIYPTLFALRTQTIFIPSGGTKTATFVLNDKDSTAVANATGIRAAWFDQMPGSSMAAPTDVSAIETSDGSGNHTINIPNSTLTSGQTGYYAISNSDGTIATNHLQGGGPAKVD